MLTRRRAKLRMLKHARLSFASALLRLTQSSLTLSLGKRILYSQGAGLAHN